MRIIFLVGFNGELSFSNVKEDALLFFLHKKVSVNIIEVSHAVI